MKQHRFPWGLLLPLWLLLPVLAGCCYVAVRHGDTLRRLAEVALKAVIIP